MRSSNWSRSGPRPDLGLASYVLRLTCAMIFIGHGLCALDVNPAWIPFFHVVGLSSDDARVWMPLVGVHDLVLAAIVLIRPVRALLLWMSLWALWAAILRPLSGGTWLEVVERSGNFGAPLALLLIQGWPRRSRLRFA